MAQIDVTEPEPVMTDEPAPAVTDQPTDGPRTGVFTIVLPLPGKTEFNARLDAIAKRYGENPIDYRKRITKEIEAAKADSDLVPPAEANDVPKPVGASDKPVEPPMAHVKYSVYVPPSYTPGKPFGMLVFINAGGGGGGAIGSYKETLDKHHVIWIAAHNSGNSRETIWRFMLALDAVRHLKAMYTIDDDRVYVGGFSGGGRASSILAVTMPDIFAGGFHFSGVNYYRNVPIAGGKFWPGYWSKPDPKVLTTARQRSRFVLQTGTKDSNQKNTKDVYGAFTADKFHTLYLEVPELGHTLPPADEFEKGLAFLDAPIVSKAETLYKQAQDLEKRKKLGEACVAYSRAAIRGSEQPWAADATAKAELLQQAYGGAIEGVRKLIDAADYVKANAAVAQLKAMFTPLADDQAAAFKDEITTAMKKPKKPAGKVE